jgi:hypothetical protein
MDKNSTTTISVSDWDPISINIDDMDIINTDDISTITIDTEEAFDITIDWAYKDIQLDLDLNGLDDKFPVHIANKLKEALEEVDKHLEKDDDLPF